MLVNERLQDTGCRSAEKRVPLLDWQDAEQTSQRKVKLPQEEVISLHQSASVSLTSEFIRTSQINLENRG